MSKILTFKDALNDVPSEWVNVDLGYQNCIDDLLWSTITELDLLTERDNVHDSLHHMTRKKAIRLCKEFLVKYKDYAKKDDTKRVMQEYI